MNIIVPESWEELLKKIKTRRAPSIIFVIGGVDTGKSTLAKFLYKQLSAEAGVVALVDADLGQSTIGPPTTVGLAVAKGSTGTLKPLSMRFVGSTSPKGHLLQTLVAVKKLLDKAIALKAKRIVIDTSGFISGNIGREFKFQKIDLVGPTHIIALEREEELSLLLENFSRRGGISIHRLKVPDGIVKLKSHEKRRLYREKKFESFFRNARLRSLYTEKIGLHGMVPDLTKKRNWHNLLVGLCDGENSTLSLGIVQDIDLSGRVISCITPIKKTDKVKTVQFGSIYLDKDGRELKKTYA